MMNIRNKVVIEESKKKENKNIFNDNPLCHRAIIHFRDNNKIILEYNFNKKEIEKEIEKENEKENEKEKKNLINYNFPLKKDNFDEFIKKLNKPVTSLPPENDEEFEIEISKVPK